MFQIFLLKCNGKAVLEPIFICTIPFLSSFCLHVLKDLYMKKNWAHNLLFSFSYAVKYILEQVLTGRKILKINEKNMQYSFVNSENLTQFY